MSDESRLVYRLAGGLRLVAGARGEASAPPVVFLHGGGQTRHAWDATARAVAAAGYFAIALDHRGHGESDWDPRADYRPETFAGDLRGVLAQIAGTPFLVGASLGGITAMLAEAAGPTSICRGIVLADVTPRLEVKGVDRILAFMGARPNGFADLEDAADFVATFLPNRPRPKDTSGLEKNLRRGPDGRLRWHWDPRLMETWAPGRLDEGVQQRAGLAEAARRLRVPALLVRGRLSDVVSEEGAREFLEMVPHAEFVDLAAAGHMVAGDGNEAFTGAVLAFLRRHGAVLGGTRGSAG